MENGRDALIVYDDLSKHAEAYRQVSCSCAALPAARRTRRRVLPALAAAGARARLNEENGGGSLTALPIIETQAGDVSAYIPTNVISITDGQIYLETDLFYAGIRPAVNAGLGLPRGWRRPDAGHAPGGRQAAPRLAQYRELAAFAQFGLRPRHRDRASSSAAAHDRGPQAAPVPAAASREAGRDHLGRHERLARRCCGRERASSRPASTGSSSRTQLASGDRQGEGAADELTAELEKALNAYKHWPARQGRRRRRGQGQAAARRTSRPKKTSRLAKQRAGEAKMPSPSAKAGRIRSRSKTSPRSRGPWRWWPRRACGAPRTRHRRPSYAEAARGPWPLATAVAAKELTRCCARRTSGA